ncbi:MAG: cysteine hydrolase [Firmicutes bacterium]|nr:cysteine hydrolase [Bacillota bacterium]
MEKYAIIVVDMIKDNLKDETRPGIGQQAAIIIPRLQFLLSEARRRGWTVIYACDSFMPEDFIFRGRMVPHALRGTPGVEVVESLRPRAGDLVLEKRSMSAFFRTDLDLTLRYRGIEAVGVTGISTPYCVLLTALDAVANGFRATIVEDCCAAHKEEVHRATLEIYRRSPLYPLFRVLTAEEFLAHP